MTLPISTPLRLGGRAVAVTATYLAASLLILATVMILRGQVSPERLRAFLAFVFIATLSAGLEPGTAKADALRPGPAAPLIAMLTASVIKALFASPVLALVWRYGDPSADLRTLLLGPLVAIAGFVATDLRVRLDLGGRHALAIGLKQGSFAGGIAAAGVVIALGGSLALAISIATGLRLGVTVLVARAARSSAPTPWEPPWPAARRLLVDPRWPDLALASVIAALGGSADRVFGLRFLGPADYGVYFLVYEVFSKFWLVPYVLTPIIFARQALGEDTRALLRGAWGLTAVAGLAFVAGAAGAMLAFPDLARTYLAGAPTGPVTAFAGGIVLSAFSQLRLAQMQGEGASRRVAVVMGVGAAIAVPLFWFAARDHGVSGLLAVWLVKSAVELALAMIPIRLARGRVGASL